MAQMTLVLGALGTVQHYHIISNDWFMRYRSDFLGANINEQVRGACKSSREPRMTAALRQEVLRK